MRFTANPLFQSQAMSVYLLTFVIALVAALILPSFSLFLESDLKARPLLVGLPFAAMALASILFNYAIGRWSDAIADRRPLIAFCCLMGILSCLVFAWSRHYWIIFAVAVSLFSFSMVAFAQILAYSLDFAKRAIPEEKVPLFNSIVRAQIALAWIGGPPLGFFLASYFGFEVAYLISAGAYGIVILMVFYFLMPLVSIRTQEKIDLIPTHKPTRFNWPLVFAVLGFSLFFGVNNAYLISLPLHLKNNLAIGAEWMGPLMGLAAGLEIPFMVLAGYWVSSKTQMGFILIAAVSAIFLYAGVYFVSQLWQLFCLQIFNAIFIGVIAGLGISIIQTLLPDQSGVASSLYTNTTHIGNLFSGLMVSVIADLWGYQEVFLVNLLLVVLAMLFFSKLKLNKL